MSLICTSSNVRRGGGRETGVENDERGRSKEKSYNRKNYDSLFGHSGIGVVVTRTTMTKNFTRRSRVV